VKVEFRHELWSGADGNQHSTSCASNDGGRSRAQPQRRQGSDQTSRETKPAYVIVGKKEAKVAAIKRVVWVEDAAEHLAHVLRILVEPVVVTEVVEAARKHRNLHRPRAAVVNQS
jgi:hypothetical protein